MIQYRIVKYDLLYDNDDSTTGTANGTDFSTQQRRRHFIVKLRSLEKFIKELKAERFEIDKERSRLTDMLKKKQKKEMALKMEKERMKDYKGIAWLFINYLQYYDVIIVATTIVVTTIIAGSSVSSSALHGTPMVYNFVDFVISIAKAATDIQQEIGDAKYAIMIGENRKKEIKRLNEQNLSWPDFECAILFVT